MTITDSVLAHTVERGDYLEINGNYLIVDQVEDNGDTVLVYGYSTLTGDNVVEETNAMVYLNLVTDD